MSVVVGENELELPVGTHVEVVRRSEHWDHHGCIQSVRTVLVELRVVATGEVARGILEQGFEDEEPWTAGSWLRDE